MRRRSDVQPVSKGFAALLSYDSRSGGRRRQLAWVLRATHAEFLLSAGSAPDPTPSPAARLYVEDERGIFGLEVEIHRTSPNVLVEITETGEVLLQRLDGAVHMERTPDSGSRAYYAGDEATGT